MIRELRQRLNAWAPIGGGTPEDEYDCMHGPIIAALARGDSAGMLAGVLREQLVGHFGLGPGEDFGEREIAISLVRWYRAWTAAAD
jgi:hypothetical protein